METVRGESDEILDLVARFYSLTENELTYGRRTMLRSWARHAAAWLLRSTGRYSLSDIARILRYHDHTSVSSGLHSLATRAAGDTILAAQLETLKDAWRRREYELYQAERRTGPHVGD